jgi:hypothetical protein
MPFFKKKPVVIEAVFWSGDNLPQVMQFMGSNLGGRLTDGGGIEIKTLEGTMTANEGDWIIRGVKNELYPCKDEVFQMTYERIGEK